MQNSRVRVFHQRLIRSILGFTPAIQSEIRVHQIAVIQFGIWLKSKGFAGLCEALLIFTEVIVDVTQIEMRIRIAWVCLYEEFIHLARFFEVASNYPAVSRFDCELFSFARPFAKFIGFLGVRYREAAFS